MPKFEFNKIALRSVKLNKSMFFPFDFQRWRMQFLPLHTTRKIKFSLRISSVDVTRSAVSCRFGHIY